MTSINGNFRKPKVLLIDSVTYTRLSMDYTLTSAGYKVTAVKDYNEAMTVISSDVPDVVLLSLKNNDNNIMILRNLKEYFRLYLDVAKGIEPPVIVLTSDQNSRQAQELQYLGAAEILFKPLNIQELPIIINRTISNRKSSFVQEKKRILIFDGEARSQQLLESILAHELYYFDRSSSESETLVKLKNKKFDLVIFDISSIESDLISVLSKVREIDKDIFVITTSALEHQISENEIQTFNIKASFTKPIDAGELKRVVDNLLGNPKPVLNNNDSKGTS